METLSGWFWRWDNEMVAAEITGRSVVNQHDLRDVCRAGRHVHSKWLLLTLSGEKKTLFLSPNKHFTQHWSCCHLTHCVIRFTAE